MGIYLSAPDKTKKSTQGETQKLKWAASSMQGWRKNMEDAHISDANFDKDIQLFAIFDGHGGSEVARFCEKYFGKELRNNSNYKNGNYQDALRETFLRMDVMLQNKQYSEELNSYRHEPTDEPKTYETEAGCTSNVVLIKGTDLYCANAGDSRCILYTNKTVIPLSEDHKPNNERELDRIQKAGGWVSEGRVNANLNLSRSIGDLEYKKNLKLKPEEQLISAFPDIVQRTIKAEDGFLVMGCDGIWEIQTEEEICNIVEEGQMRGFKMSEIVEEILDKGCAVNTESGSGCDNMSSIVVCFNH